MNDILMWIYNAVSTVFWGGVVLVIAIALFGLIWPYIAAMVKFFAVALPAGIIYMLVSSRDWGLAIRVLLIGGAIVGVLWLLFRFLDNKFGILMTEDEARSKGYL